MGGGTREFYIRFLFRNLQSGGGARGFYIRLLFRNLQEGRRGVVDSMVWSKPSPPLSFKLNHWKGGGLEGLILGSYLEKFEEGCWGGDLKVLY